MRAGAARNDKAGRGVSRVVEGPDPEVVVSSIVVGLLIFGSVFGGSLLGMWLRTRLPEHHVTGESKDVVKLGMGLVGTMTALVLGLLVASAKSSYDTQKAEISQMAAKVIWLDRILERFEPSSHEARLRLSTGVDTMIGRMWPEDRSQGSHPEPPSSGVETVYGTLLKLTPENDEQRRLMSEAEKVALDLQQARWLLYEQSGRSVSVPLLLIVTIWLTLTFLSYGLFAPLNLTVGLTLFVSSLSVAGALFLVLELDRPFDGIIRIPNTPMLVAKQQLLH